MRNYQPFLILAYHQMYELINLQSLYPYSRSYLLRCIQNLFDQERVHNCIGPNKFDPVASPQKKKIATTEATEANLFATTALSSPNVTVFKLV